MIASAPASKTNVSRRRAGRGEDGAAWTSTGSGPSVINSQTIVFGRNSWCQRAFRVHSSKLPAEPWLHLCHGYRRPERPLDAPEWVPSAIFSAWTLIGPPVLG